MEEKKSSSVVREIDQELIQTSLSGNVILQNLYKGGISQFIRQTLSKGFSSSTIAKMLVNGTLNIHACQNLKELTLGYH